MARRDRTSAAADTNNPEDADVPLSAKNWIVDTDWLAAHLDAPDLVIFDGSWHLPTAQRDPKAEYLEAHIPGALFFDIDDFNALRCGTSSNRPI